MGYCIIYFYRKVFKKIVWRRKEVKRFLMIGLLIALMFTIPSMSFANICFWKACPQDTGAYKLKYGAVEPTPVPDIAFLANINLSGETDYIFLMLKMAVQDLE